MTNPPGEDPTQPDQPHHDEPGTPPTGDGSDADTGQAQGSGPSSAPGSTGGQEQGPGQPPPPGQPGYWEQQAQQQAQQQPPPYASYPPQYPPPNYPGQAPIQYAPDHPRATTSLVMGILGVVLCQVLAPFAWVMGKRTLDEIDASQGQLGGRGAAQAGFILGIVGSVLLGLSLIFLAIYAVLAVAVIGGGIATN
jgi:hypothetical protein